MNTRKISRNSFLKLTAAGLAAAALAACGGSSASTSTASSAAASSTAADSAAAGSAGTIRYGKSQGPYTELFEAAIVPILGKEGYTVEGTDFSELLTADIALNDGEVDVNVEQHTAYAENFNASYNGDLTPISPIPTVPAGIFSDTHTSLDEIADGAKVAVPNDASTPPVLTSCCRRPAGSRWTAAWTWPWSRRTTSWRTPTTSSSPRWPA